ncbi:C4-dicarboxylate ABC transporter [Desulfomarina profundi]|uniref:C4-dicarboxylate ABC transporter n=1 Tax=Desulfomarina profundi TaxID=2772557 RepID=A0A8D5JEC7_9BACT|nr:TRAP transporter large permease subunit [Desulfomarina profundi]BCL62343.1 C4-dicarboxylate ABC transporter [Desulfomarina profundi]
MPFEIYPLLMFGVAVFILLMGYPVAFSLSGTAILFALFGVQMDVFDLSFFGAYPERIFGIMRNQTLIAIPLFIFMGVMLERSKISEELLETMGMLFGKIRGGLGISVCIVGALLAASTGIVGATVVTMGLISLPSMLRFNYSNSLASGIVAASGTLGQIIPPSIILIILGDVISSAHQQAQLAMGNFSPTSVSVGDLFVGALLPGLVLVGLYIFYIAIIAFLKPDAAPALPNEVLKSVTGYKLWVKVGKVLIPPLLLIMGVLGSILAGLATPTEAASVGCVGGIVLTAFKGQLNLKILREVMITTTHVNCMVFVILLGASMFSLVFRGFEGDVVVHHMLTSLPGGVASAFLVVMLIMFIMGFFLDFFEITFVVVPIVGPILLMMGLDPIWLGVMIAINLQTSFLTPPFGFALFYLRGVAPDSVSTMDIYKGVVPFIFLQLLMLIILWFWPSLATWLPGVVYGTG